MLKFFSKTTRIHSDQYLSVLLVALLLIIPGSFQKIKNITPQTISLVKESPIPVRRSSQLAELNLEDHNLAFINALSFYVIDVDSGSILAEKNANQTLYPASTTKIMTALVARELYGLNEIITVPQGVKEQGNGMGLIVGEQMTVENLLYGLLIPSGNDAAFTLASYYSSDNDWGEKGFVDKMNEKTRELHLDNTHFVNPAGFDDEKQISTARDLAILAKELLKDDFLSEVVSTSSKTVTDISGKNSHFMENTNHLLGVLDGVRGIKTGTTLLAGEVLVTLVERDGHSIIVALLASNDRFSETTQIVEWVFKNYEWI